MGGKQWKPQRARSGTSQVKASSPSSSDTYLPCLHTHTRRNKPTFCLGPTTRLPDTFSQLWSNRQSTKGTRCFTDTHLPLPLSSVRARLPKSRAEIMQTLCSLVGIFCHCSLSPCIVFTSFVNVGADEAAWKSRVEQRLFFKNICTFLVHLQTNYSVTKQHKALHH